VNGNAACGGWVICKVGDRGALRREFFVERGICREEECGLRSVGELPGW